MSSKKVVLDAKKTGQSRKNRRRSSRTTNSTNGEADDPKERCVKRPRDLNSKEKENADGSTEDGQDSDIYKEIIDLLPAQDLNCSPAELPAPPGTRVNLHGVILHETQGGLIVLNVRWRNRVYSGALIDAEKSKWATDRISNEDDDAPSLEDKQFQAPPPIKKLRIPTNNNADDSDSGTKKKGDVISPTMTPTKTGPKTPGRGNGKKRSSQESPPAVQAEETGTPGNRKTKGKLLYNGEHLYECCEPNCEKKYKNKNGLSYHIRTAHPTKTESCDGSGKENKSDSRDDSDSGDDNFVIDEKADEESKDGDMEEGKAIAVDEPNGSQSDGEGEEEKKEEQTENEKRIESLKLEAEKVQALLSGMKDKEDDEMEIKQEDKEASANDTVPYDSIPPSDDPAIENMKTESGETVKSELKTEPADTEPAEPLVDVESDAVSNFQWKNGEKEGEPSVPVTSAGLPVSGDGQPIIPTITVEPSPNETTEGNDETKGDHPKGTSRTIIHEDHMNSLNELFAPAVSYQQYSPTLTNLNPQKITESLNDALLSKQSAATTSSGTITAQSKIENVSSSMSMESAKEALTAKPSIELNRSEPISTMSMMDNRIPLDFIKDPDYARGAALANDCVAGSDDERSVSPENALIGCHKTFPQEERDSKAPKPNILPIPLNTSLNSLSTSSIYMNPLLATMLEHSMSMGQPQRTFEKGLMFKDLGSKVAMASSTMNIFQQQKGPGNLSNVPSKISQEMPLPPNVDPMSLTSGGIVNSSQATTDTKPILPFDPSNREFPIKQTLLEQRLLASNNARTSKTCESPGVGISSATTNSFPMLSTPFDTAAPSNREFPGKPSLLEQRLLEPNKTDAMVTSNVTSANKMFHHQTGSGGGPVPTTSGSKPDDVNKNNENNDKVPASSAFGVNNRDPAANDKSKGPATSLRINPPTSGDGEPRELTRGHTWFPEVVNEANSAASINSNSLSNPDYYHNSPPIVSSSFRIPPKTYPSYSLPSAIPTSMTDPKNPKGNLKPRSIQPVPIAPAPSPGMQAPRNEFNAPQLDYASPNGDKEQPQMARFTLSNNRLVPSPVENRGRPRKVRVEKTKQIPIGTAQDIAKVRGPAETSLTRKPSSSPVVRTSVIQGSIHPGMEGSPKPSERGMDGHMVFPTGRDMRNYDVPPEDRERFGLHEKDVKPPHDMRPGDKYQGIGSPPGMYFSQVGRGLLSPPLPRSDHSPRSVDMMTRPVDALARPGPGAPMRRSSPVGHREGFSNSQFQMALAERMADYNQKNSGAPGGPDHARNVLEHRRQPEHLRPSESPHDRKHPLSPLSETLHVMQAYARAQEHERDQRMAEYLGTGRYQPPPPSVRGEFVPGRSDGPRSMFEHRISPEESEQARLIRDRERYMQQSSLSRPNVYRGSPPSHTTPGNPGAHHSANLVLGTADGSIIGPLSSYENRSAEHKR